MFCCNGLQYLDGLKSKINFKIKDMPKIEIMGEGIKKDIGCETLEESATDLEEKGYQQVWSFHADNADQWNEAYDKVQELKTGGKTDVVLVKGDYKEGLDADVHYVYKKH